MTTCAVRATETSSASAIIAGIAKRVVDYFSSLRRATRRWRVYARSANSCFRVATYGHAAALDIR